MARLGGRDRRGHVAAAEAAAGGVAGAVRDVVAGLVVAGDEVFLELGQLAFVIQLFADITCDGAENQSADHCV